MTSSTNSIQQATWRKLKKNKAAVFGIFIIFVAVVLAIFAYLIAPDASPNANRMIVEIGGQKPGSRQMYLKEKKEGPVLTVNFLERLLYGQEESFHFIPV